MIKYDNSTQLTAPVTVKWPTKKHWLHNYIINSTETSYTLQCSMHIYWCPCVICRVLNHKHSCINTPKFEPIFHDADVRCKMPLTYSMLSKFVLMQLNQEIFFYLTKN